MSSEQDRIVYRPDLRDAAVANLISAYKGKTRIEALVRSLAGGAQTLEDQAFGLLVSTTLSAASGDLLEKWGTLVGEDRVGLDDIDYRVFVNARILANNSNGTTDDMIGIWQLVTAPYIDLWHTDHYPAAFSLWVIRSEAMSDERARRVGRLMRDVKPGGIAMDLVEAVAGYYGFQDDPGAFPLDVGLLSRSL